MAGDEMHFMSRYSLRRGNSFMFLCSKLFLRIVAVVVAALLGASSSSIADEATSNGIAWLALIDQGRSDEALSATSADMQSRVSRAFWSMEILERRAPLGSLVSRDCQTRFRGKKAQPAGAPAVPYVTLDCVTSFSNRPSVHEILCMLGSGDGWKVDCYAVDGFDFAPVPTVQHSEPFASAHCKPVARTDRERRIASLISSAKAEADARKRTDRVEQLRDMFLGSDKSASDCMIDEIAELLSDNDEFVRVTAAETLEEIGPPAKRTLPALKRLLETEEALTRSRNYGQDLSGDGIVRAAIVTIEGRWQ